MAYTFEQQQKIKFVVYDIDGNSPKLSDHDFIGCCETTMGQIVSSGKSPKAAHFVPKLH